MGGGPRAGMGENIFSKIVFEALGHMCMQCISCLDQLFSKPLCALHACAFESGGMPSPCMSKLVLTQVAQEARIFLVNIVEGGSLQDFIRFGG